MQQNFISYQTVQALQLWAIQRNWPWLHGIEHIFDLGMSANLHPVDAMLSRSDNLNFLIQLKVDNDYVSLPLTVDLFTGKFTLGSVKPEPLDLGDPGETCYSEIVDSGGRVGICWTLEGICPGAKCSNGVRLACAGDPCTRGPSFVPACNNASSNVSCDSGAAACPPTGVVAPPFTCSTTGNVTGCAGDACTTDPNPNPACGGVSGSLSCSSSIGICAAPPLLLNAQTPDTFFDDDCSEVLDVCSPDQVGKSFACTTAYKACPRVAGMRKCDAAGMPPGPCVPIQKGDNFCQMKCANETPVSDVAGLQQAIGNARMTPCKDVIVLAPGTYNLTEPLQIENSMEIRGQGSSYDCKGVKRDESSPWSALDEALVASELDAQIGSLHCDGDDGEDPSATVLRNVARQANKLDGAQHRVMELGLKSASYPEVTLRHLTIEGGFITVQAASGAGEGAGIDSHGGPLKLFNVVIADNEARGQGAGLFHQPPRFGYPRTATLVMVNSTVRRNVSTQPALGTTGVQGNGGGIHLEAGVSFILRSTIDDNAALRGAGIAATGTLHVYNSTIAHNLAATGGAGIRFEPRADFGGLLELRNNTITNNFARWLPGTYQAQNEAWGAALLITGTSPGPSILNGGVAELYGNIIADNFLCGALEGLRANCWAEEGASFRSLGSNVGGSSKVGGPDGKEYGPDCGFVAQNGSNPISDKILDIGFSHDQFGYETEVSSLCHKGQEFAVTPEEQVGDAERTALGELPSADHSVLDRSTGKDISLVGALASQGGPTETMAPGPGSPVIAATQSVEQGAVNDGFPSAPPLCPVADQTGAPTTDASGAPVSFPPPTCNAGSWQRPLFATAAYVDPLQNLFSDTDGDGIADVIDQDPSQPSFAFSDLLRGGVTQGRIVARGDQTLRLFDGYPNPQEGVLVIALPSGGAAPAQLNACNGTVSVSATAGETKVITCPQQPPLCVLATEDLNVGDRVLLDVPGVFGNAVAIGPSILSSALFSVAGTTLTRASIAGDVTSAGSIVGAAQSSIGGAVSEHAYVLPRALASTSVPFGVTDVTLGNDQSRTLSPGSYRALVVGNRSVLTFAPGIYLFKSLVLQNDARVIVSGPVQVKSDSGFQVMDRVRVTDPSGAPASGALAEWYTNANDVTIGHDVVWAGSLVAPSSHVAVNDRGRIDGCLAGRRVDLYNDSTITAQRFLTAGALTTKPTAPSCNDGVLNHNESDVDCGGVCVATCPVGAHCAATLDCLQGATCVSGVCTVTGGACTEATAVDLGVPGQITTVPNSGCVRVRDGYPSWWGVRNMKLETIPTGTYPVPLTWSNACTRLSGSGSFTADWQAQRFAGISASCATVVRLQGSGSGNVTIRYWAE